jgi:hypothetical protein
MKHIKATKAELVSALRTVADCGCCEGCQDVALGFLRRGQTGVSIGEALEMIQRLVTLGGLDHVWDEAQELLQRAKLAGMI